MLNDKDAKKDKDNTLSMGVSHLHSNNGKFTPKFIGRSFPTTTGNEGISRFPITKGRRKVDHNSRLSLPRHELIIPKLL